MSTAVPDLLGTSPADLIDRRARGVDASAETARERADRIRAGLASFMQMRQDIADAYAQRDWVALGYGSWGAYVDAEFGAQRGLPRDERREAVAELRQIGMSQRAIASTLGVDQKTVSNDLRSTEENSSVDQPERITSLDGRERPATRPSTSSGQSLPAPTPSPIPEQIDNDPDVQAHEFMRRFMANLRTSIDVTAFDPDRVAALADATEVEALQRHADSLTAFVDKVHRARTGLRIIKGGAS